MTMNDVSDVAVIASYGCSVLDNASDAVAIFTADDTSEARIVYANAAHLRLSGYTRDELVGRSAALLDGSRPSTKHALEMKRGATEALAEKAGVVRRRKYRPDASFYDVEIDVVPLRDSQEKTTHFVLTQRDVTARRNAEAEELAQRLMAERFGELARLAAGTAHELEPPLSQIVVQLRAALDGLAMGEERGATGALRNAMADAEHIQETVRGLKAFTRDAGDEPEELDVHEAIELATRLTQLEVGRRATLARRYAALPHVAGSLSGLAQVFVSLLRNAAESIPSGIPHANKISIHTDIARDGSVFVEVTDTGVGIDPKDLPFVFDPFFTTKPRAASAGLGLAIARATVLEMGGTITVDSTLGRGTCFRVTLPALKTSRGRALPFLVNATPAIRRILCVADDPGEAKRLGELLDDGDAQVVYATSEEALAELSLGVPYALDASDSRTEARNDFRARLHRLAGGVLARTFQFHLVPKRAFACVEVPMKEPANDLKRAL